MIAAAAAATAAASPQPAPPAPRATSAPRATQVPGRVTLWTAALERMLSAPPAWPAAAERIADAAAVAVAPERLAPLLVGLAA